MFAGIRPVFKFSSSLVEYSALAGCQNTCIRPIIRASANWISVPYLISANSTILILVVPGPAGEAMALILEGRSEHYAHL